jgi:beta-phosphoglucomutase-like phosphatase (HAD superfamily)
LDGVVFDLDGTLIDTVKAHALSWLKAFEANGFSTKIGQIEPLIGLDGKKIVEDLFGKGGLKFFPSIRNYKDKVYLELIEHVTVFPGARETLSELKGDGFKLALATSTVSSVLPNVLEKLRLNGYFQAIVSGDRITRGKPAPEIRVDPARGAVVGDTEYDILPAIRIGTTSVIVLHGRKIRLSVRPNYTIDELPELLKIFKK